MRDVARLRAELHRNPRGAAEAAGPMLTAARAEGDGAGAAELLVVRGRARRALGEIDLAERDLREAVADATALRDDELVADANLALSGVLVFAGRTAEAFACLDTARELGSAPVRALADAQHGVIEQVLGHRPEALARMDAAVAGLRDLGDAVQLARVLVNRGTVLTELGDARAAIADLLAAHEAFSADGQDFVAAQILHNLGYAHGLAGDLPAALRYFDRAAALFRATGHDAPEVEMDRVEVLLSAGLAADAADRAQSVVQLLAAAGDRHKEAVARLSHARALTAAGHPDRGRAAADDAARAFAALGQRPWELLARLDALPDPAPVEELLELAASFDACGNARAATRAHGLAAVAAARAGADASALADEAGRRAGQVGSPELLLLAAQARAEEAASRGDTAAAQRHARAGVGVLTRHRATLAATEARAAVAARAADLTRLGLRAAVRDGDAVAALRWMDTGRWAAATAPARDDDALAEGLARLRTLAAQARAAEADGEDAGHLLDRIRDLQESLRDRTLAATVPAPVAHPDVALEPDALRAGLDGGTLAAATVLDARLSVVLVRPAGPAELLDLGPAEPALRAVAAVAGGLRQATDPRRPAAARSAGLAGVRRGLDGLDTVLAPVLRGDGPLTLVLPPALHAVPWHLSRAVAGRPVAVAPSVAWWTAGAPPAGPGTALAVAGPRLRHADDEAAAVAAVRPGTPLLTGAAATADAVLTALAGADVAHLACHARSRADSPLWSSLELADGPVHGYDLERLPRLPRLVVLSGCHTATGSAVGDRLLGLASVFLDGGSRGVLGSLALLPDTATTGAVLAGLHRHLADGAGPPAALAAVATHDGPWDDPDLVAVLACLTAYGAHR